MAGGRMKDQVGRRTREVASTCTADVCCEATLVIDIESHGSPRKLEHLKALSEDRCPASDLFTEVGYPHRTTWNVVPMRG